MDAAHDPARNEQRPALDVDGADERSQDSRRSTNQAADSPSADRVVPATKNAAMPNCATASVAAFRTDMNDRSAVDDKIART